MRVTAASAVEASARARLMDSSKTNQIIHGLLLLEPLDMFV